MKKTILLTLAAIALTPWVAQAQKETLGVSDIKPTPALVTSVQASGKKLQLDQVLQSLDSQLIERINATRKFTVVSRSDLPALIPEQDLIREYKLAGATNLLITTIEGFEDASASAPTETGQIASRRVVRLNATGKIWKTVSGTLLEAASFQVVQNAGAMQLVIPGATSEGKLGEDLLVSVAREMAQKIANRVTDVVFPIKVIGKTDKQITLNRGDGSDIAVGEIFNVYAIGKELKDPDTGEVSREEVPIGKARIDGVQPKFSTAEILEDNGIAEGAILRRPQSPPPSRPSGTR